MKNLNAIGLESIKAKKLAGKLNELLANYSIFYQNTQIGRASCRERVCLAV